MATISLPLRCAGIARSSQYAYSSRAPATQSRALNEPGLVVDAGVDDATRVARLVRADRRLTLEHDDAEPSWRNAISRADREADDPGADDDEVAFARRPARSRCETSARCRCHSSHRSSPSSRSRASSCRPATGWAYEPKYDGFRALAFVDGSELFLQSRTGRPLARYFPELEFPEGRYVIDGELLILDDDGREVFDALQNRLHPAESRVKMLAEQTPALFRAFDLLAVGDERRRDPFEERRAALEQLIGGFADPGSVELTPLVERGRPRPSPGSRAARA